MTSLGGVSDIGASGLEQSGLLEAILSIASDLDLDGVLERIVAAACTLTDATFGALGVLDPSGTELVQFITHGISASERSRIGAPPRGSGVLGLLIKEPHPLRLADLVAHPSFSGFPAHHPPMHSFLGVPIRVRDVVFGNLYLTEKRSADEFSEQDERLLSSLAAAAGVAIDNARLHQRLGEMALFEDRERIARDLHDTVIQRLFAVGLSLQGLAQMVEPASAGARIEVAVDELDLTIADIRSTIFALQSRSDTGLRARIARLVTESREGLGFLARVTFEGPIDAAAAGTEVAEEAATVVREALSNVVRHARATKVDVAVLASGQEFSVSVADDGIGIRRSASSGGHGLRNMASRAERLGGSFEVRSEPGEGTLVTWRVPL